MTILRGLLAGLLLVLFWPGRTGAAEVLERELLRQAPRVCQALQAQGYHAVALLDFLVTQNGRCRPDHSAGLHLFLAQQLEVALVLAGGGRRPLALIPSAAVRQRLPRANPYLESGRCLFRAVRYPLAWGDREVLADAFLLGTAVVSPDRTLLFIRLFVFDRATGLKPLGDWFSAQLPADRRTALGESFGPPASSPVVVEVRYHGQAVALEMEDGQACVPPRPAGHKLELVLKCSPAARERYGVVLKVNGENVLERQRLPDFRCRRWQLEPGTSVPITGFENEDQTRSAFEVLTEEDLRQRQLAGDPGDTFALTVFREQRGPRCPPDISDEAVAATAVAHAALPLRRPANFHALKALLLQESNYNAQLLKEDAGTGRDPVPLSGLTIVTRQPWPSAGSGIRQSAR